MPVKIQPTYTRFQRKYTACAIGDSVTHSYSWGMTPADHYCHQLEKLLRAQDCPIQVRNFGIASDTSAQGVARMSALTQFEVPDIGIIYYGINDPTTTVSASPSPTSTVFTVASTTTVLAKPGSHITVAGEAATVLSVAGNAITLTAALAGGAPAAGASVVCDTTANIVEIGQFLKDAGCSRIVVALKHYLNYSSGGDTVNTPLSNGVTQRAAQNAAVTALGSGVIAGDVYTYMRNRIVAGTDTQGSYSWHVLDSNVHLNTYGQLIFANALYDAIDTAGWLSALT